MFKAYMSTGGDFATNGLLFATVEDAEIYAADLACRWTLVRDWEIRPATDEEISSGRLATVNGFVQ